MDQPTHHDIPRRRRGKTILVLVLVTGLVFAALFAISLLLNSAAVKNALLQEVEQRTGHRLAAESVELKLFPRPRLDLRELRLFDQGSEAPLMSARHLDVVLRISPLLEGRVAAAYVVLESPRLAVRRHPSRQWTLGDRAPEAVSEPTGGQPSEILAMLGNLLIVDGTIAIVDESHSVLSERIQLTSVQLTMTEEIPGRTAKVQISGEMPQGSIGSAVFTIEGALAVVSGEAGAPQEAARALQADATIRLHRLDVRHIAASFGLKSTPTGSGPSAQFVGHVRLVPRPVGYDLIVTDWQAGFSEVALQGTATLTGLGTAQARASASLSASSVPLKHTLSQVPAEWVSPDIRDKLTEHAVEAFVSLHDAHVVADLGENRNVNIDGTVELRDGRFVLGGTHPPVRDVTATVIFDLEQLRITGLRGHYGTLRFSDGTALVTGWRAEPMIDLRISGEARAGDMIALLIDQGRFPRLASDLSQLEQVTGDVGMTAHLAGQPGKGDLDVEEVSVAIRNLGFRHQAVAVPFRQVQASIKVSPTEIELAHLSGQAGPARVEAGGRVLLSGEPSFQGMVLNVTVEGQSLAPWLHQAASEQFRPIAEGPVFLSTSVTGAVRAPRFHGKLTLDGTGFRVPHVFTKAKGAPAGIRFEGELHEDRLLSVRRCELIFPPVRLTGEGRIRLADDWEFRARIRSNALSLDKLPHGVRLGPVRAGIIKGGLKMEGRATDRTSWVTTGLLRVDHGLLEEQLQDPIKDLSMRLRFDGKNIEIRRLAFAVGESDIRLSGSIDGWLKDPRVKLVVESSQLDIASLKLARADGSSSDSFPVMRSWWGDGSVDATVLIDYAYYERTLLSGLSCRLRFQHGTLTIDRISGDTDDGHLGGRVVLNMSEQGRRSVRSSWQVSGLPVDRLAALIDDKPRISGWLAAKGGIQAEFGQDRLFRSTINSRRPISVIVERGHLFYAPVIAKVLSLMNLPALLKGKADLTKDGMPLDRLKLVFGVEDGIINVSEFLLDSPVLKISGTGRYDFIDDKFDAMVVASPLGQYSELLKSVPLFGKLFAGERQGFDTAIFQVKGPAKDPDVVYLPAESLMAGAKGTAKLAFDLLVNAITLPKEAFSMGEDDAPVEDDEVLEGPKGS
jgi:hypothetical protein